jgi:uncharacterized membrane protein
VLDAMRTVAILLMIASHTTRLIVWDERREWSRFSLLIEPFTASLFLILVGVSLVQSFLKAERESAAGGLPFSRARWLRRQSVRALLLWAVSAAFYAASEGFLLPDALVLSGILATIAYTILITGLLLAAPRPGTALSLAAAAALGLYAWLDLGERRVFALNAGNSPLLPLGLGALCGALAALSAHRRPRLVKPLLLGAAILALGLVLARHPFGELFSKPVGRYETARTFLAEGSAEVRKTVPYYNLRIILFPAIVSLAVLLYAALAAGRPLLDRGARHMLRLGRRSLDVYILHLALLAVFVVAWGKRPLKETWQGDAVFLGVVAVCHLWAMLRDAWSARRAASRTGTAAPASA